MSTSPPPSLLEKLERLEAEVVHGLLVRLRLAWLLRHFPARPVWAVFMLVNGFLSIALLALVGMLSGTPFIFPSLGPTAFLLFFTPRAAAACPRHCLCGHALGILCGYGALWLTGLQDAGPALAEGIHGPRVLAAALSLACTGSLMILARVVHPPAGATTLIISLGIITSPLHLVVIEMAVAMLVLQAFLINHLAGIDYPLWGPQLPCPRQPTAPGSANDSLPRPGP